MVQTATEPCQKNAAQQVDRSEILLGPESIQGSVFPWTLLLFRIFKLRGVPGIRTQKIYGRFIVPKLTEAISVEPGWKSITCDSHNISSFASCRFVSYFLPCHPSLTPSSRERISNVHSHFTQPEGNCYPCSPVRFTN